jgi:hypothetical protein
MLPLAGTPTTDAERDAHAGTTTRASTTMIEVEVEGEGEVEGEVEGEGEPYGKYGFFSLPRTCAFAFGICTS